MDPAAAKQQITERVRQANNILVTVSNNPTVDQLAACIGLTLLLNKMGKHATAVFSGHVPSTIEFLQPEKTLETNTDSLRDFIISLDKDKADKLRYKVEDDVVKIFITPYRTSLSEKDLVFSQGDFNVEVVMALGIKDRGQIDNAIAAHGRILHDATVISLSNGDGKAPDIGQINWQEPTASSLSEMLVSISESFGGGLIDNQIATAFLTGIVAETNRFANTKTTPKVMTMSAQLMAAGANQQLIVSKLEQPLPQVAQSFKPAVPKIAEAPAGDEGTLNIKHEIEAKLKESEKHAEEEVEKESGEIHIDEQGNIKAADDLIKPLSADKDDDEDQEEDSSGQPAEEKEGTEADEESEETDESDMPGSHAMLNPSEKQPSMGSPFTASTQPEWQDPYDSVPLDPLSGDGPGKDRIYEHKTVIKPLSEQTAAKAEESEANSDTEPAKPANVDKARSAVESALADAPFDPALKPEASLGASDLGPSPRQSEKNGTPSLPLPGSGQSQPDDDKAEDTSETSDSSAPPPIPPPLIPLPTAPKKSDN